MFLVFPIAAAVVIVFFGYAAMWSASQAKEGSAMASFGRVMAIVLFVMAGLVLVAGIAGGRFGGGPMQCGMGMPGGPGHGGPEMQMRQEGGQGGTGGPEGKPCMQQQMNDRNMAPGNGKEEAKPFMQQDKKDKQPVDLKQDKSGLPGDK